MSEPPPPPPPGEPAEPWARETPEPAVCPNCGAPHDPYQEYCLECGRRLPVPAAYRRELWTRESPLWLWAALAALLLVALVAGAIVAVAATRDDEEAEGRRTVPIVSSTPTGITTIGTGPAPGTLTITPPTTTITPTSTPTLTLPTTTGATTTTTTVSWPSGRDGYTVVLKSVPTSEGRSEADAAAERARSQGLPQPGVLNSSNYSSLNPGYYVAFSGIYDTEAQAEGNLSTARSRGFPLAYVREVAN
jgi:hypothetical protein